MLNLTHVSAFLAVVETGSFHEAATRLGISQSTVSHGLKRLEATLGALLIIRHRDGCVPSRHGNIFLPFARSLVALSKRSVAQLSNDCLRIGASSNVGIYLLQPHLRRLVDAGFAEPDLVIGTNPEIADRLETREIELAFMEWWDGRPGFEARRWATDRLVLIVSPDHSWAGRTTIEREALFTEPFLGGERGTGTGTLLRDVLGPDASRLRITRVLGSTEAVKRAVAAGLGVSLVLESAVADEAAWGKLCTVAVAGVSLEKTLWAVRSDDLWPASPVMDALNALMGSVSAEGSPFCS